MSKQQPRNENPIPQHPQNHSRASQESPPPLQAQTQTTGSSPLDALAQWRSSLTESKRLDTELARLEGIRTGLKGESATLNLEIVKICDEGISQPARRAELAVELSRLCARNTVLEHEQAAINRGLDKVITKLQKNLLDGSYGWSVLAQRYQDDVLERQTRELLSGAENPNDAMRSGALELAKGSQAVRDAAKYSHISSVSFAWSRPVTAELRDGIMENLQVVAGVHVRLAQPLLEAAATLTSLPPFEEPEKAPPESHLDWLEPLGADQSLVDRLIADSGKKRSELSEEQLDIVIRAASGHNSYLRDKVQLSEYAAGTSL